MIVFFLLFLPLVGGDERGPPIVIEGQDQVVDLEYFDTGYKHRNLRVFAVSYKRRFRL